MDIEDALLSINNNKNPFAFTSLGGFVSNLIELLMFLAAVATLIYLVWGGIEWITAGGDKAGTEKARGKITDAVIGLFVVFAAWAIFALLQTFLGFNVANIGSGTTGGGTGAKNCGAQQTAWVQTYAPGCVGKTSTDWGCWKTFIEKDPCKNFNDGTGSYWPHQGCGSTIPPNICK